MKPLPLRMPTDLSDDSAHKMANQMRALSSRKSRRTSGPSSTTTTPLPVRPKAPEPLVTNTLPQLHSYLSLVAPFLQ